MKKNSEIGERCLIDVGSAVYFAVRVSQNFYQSGNLKIRVDDNKVISLIEMD